MKKVLIIDDNTILCRMLARALSAQFCVTTSAGVGEALGLFSEGRAFDAVLCDMFLDDGTGKEFYRRLRERSVDQSDRILFITGHEWPDEETPFYRATRGRHLMKPIATDALIAHVAMMAGDSGPTGGLAEKVFFIGDELPSSQFESGSKKHAGAGDL